MLAVQEVVWEKFEMKVRKMWKIHEDKKYERFMKIKNVKDSFQQSYINPWKSVDIVREKQTADDVYMIMYTSR